MATVNRPTDVRQKEKDINQKLQLYGIYSGMASTPCCRVPCQCASLDRPACAREVDHN